MSEIFSVYSSINTSDRHDIVECGAKHHNPNPKSLYTSVYDKFFL
jgi:hypothetical protein